MRIVVQLVKQASVSVDEKVISEIKKGYLILLGIETEDTQEDINWLASKIARLRSNSFTSSKGTLKTVCIAGLSEATTSTSSSL